jgi:hypothetical protein
MNQRAKAPSLYALRAQYGKVKDTQLRQLFATILPS